MVIALILGLCLLGAGVTLLVRGWSQGNARTTETLGQIPSYGFGAQPVQAAEEGARSRPLSRLADEVGSLVSRVFGAGDQGIGKLLLTAGLHRTSPKTIVGYRVLAATGGAFVAIWLGLNFGAPIAFAILLAVVLGAVGWMLPIVLLNRKGRTRTEQIDYELPELIDLLVVTLEAGVGFLGALNLAAERIKGPLGVELRLMLQEQRMGLTTAAALTNMLGRCETPGLRTFVRSLLQGEALGVSTGQIMRNLAIEMRKRRRAMAEERAQKAPVKLLFPLVFLIFPAMFIVLLGPVYYALQKAFGDG